MGRLEINGTDVTGDLCKFAQIGFANIEVFVGNRERCVFFFFLFSFLFFLLLTEPTLNVNRVPLSVLGDPNPIDEHAVRNDKGASVGQVVGNGMQFLYGRSNFFDFREEVSTVKITLFLDVDLLRGVPGSYVFDFGIEILDKEDKKYPDEVEIRPLGATLASGEQIQKGTTVSELLDDLGDQDVCVLFLFCFCFVFVHLLVHYLDFLRIPTVCGVDWVLGQTF